MVQRCPAIFSFSPEALDVSVQALSALTGLQACQVPQLLIADPTLLLQPDRLKRNQQELCIALGIPAQEVANLAYREPQVLTLSGQQVESRLGALASLFQTSPCRMAMTVVHHPALLIQPPEEVEEQLMGMQIFLHVGLELLTPLVLSKPSLLALPPQLLSDRVQHLARAAGVHANEVLQHAAQCPDVLAASSCFVERRARELAKALCCREADVTRMLVVHPHLVAQPAGALLSKWQMLGALAGTHAGWCARLRSVTADERGTLLGANYTVIARLRYLVDFGLQDECDLVSAVQATDALFVTQYPGFRAWLLS